MPVEQIAYTSHISHDQLEASGFSAFCGDSFAAELLMGAAAGYISLRLVCFYDPPRRRPMGFVENTQASYL